MTQEIFESKEDTLEVVETCSNCNFPECDHPNCANGAIYTNMRACPCCGQEL